MKIALVHELLTMCGGAENLFEVVAGMFPNAPIYTLLYDGKKLGDRFPKERIITSGLQAIASCIPSRAIRYNHHFYLNRFPKSVESWDFSGYDLVISSSSAFAHGIITRGRTKHLCYVNSPARYLWDRTHDVISRAGEGTFGYARRKYLENAFHRLRQWDAYASERPDKLLSASKAVQRRIELYWRRKSTVVYPCISDSWFQNRATDAPGEYFLVVSSLVPYKRIDLAIRACAISGAGLKIAGEGPDRKRLQRLSSGNVEFLGYCPIDKIRSLYAGARATIFPGEEDFGLVPVESMACGTPVIAFGRGGALETVEENKTGVFFGKPNAASLAEALRGFNPGMFDSDYCRKSAKRFSRTAFEKNMRLCIDSMFA